MDNLYVWAEGRAADAIHRSVERLYRTGRYFQDWRPGSDALGYVLDALFPDGGRAAFHVANVSIGAPQDGNIVLALRPVIDTPEGWPFPRGFSLGVRAWWPRLTQQPVLMVQDVFEIADGPTRDFERAIEVFVYRANPNVSGAPRQNNALSKALAEQLPRISAITEDKLRDWNSFIAWKRKLVNARTEGLRYVARRWQDERSLAFTVVADATSFERISRMLAREDVHAYPVEASSDDRVFRPAESKGRRRIETYALGRAQGANRQADARKPDRAAPEETIEWIVSVSDDDHNVLGAAEDPEAVRTRILEQIPEEGFLSLSMAGDLALLDRHERAVRKLREQGGYSPYLSAFLFDVRQARPPVEAAEPAHWYNADLKASQRSAVRKMLTAPDLCLIQGPPGTGKTTVIAEAILHLVERGQSVLLASQAHTAVDNALDRLRSSPAVRAIRLGRTNKVTKDGQQFAEAASLARYYGALAEHAQRTHLDCWAQEEVQRRALATWCDRAAYLEQDAAALQAQQNAHAAQEQALAAQRQRAWADLQSQAQAHEDACAVRRALQDFAHALTNPGAVQLTAIPAALLPAVEAAAAAILQLHECGVIVNVTPLEWERLQDRRGQLFDLLLGDAQRVQSLLPVLEDGLQRIASGGLGAVQDPSIRLRLQQLEAEIEALALAIETSDDEALVRQWRDKREERKKLKLIGTAGLDQEACRNLFRTPQPWLALGADAGTGQERRDDLQRVRAVADAMQQTLEVLRRSVAQALAESKEPLAVDESGWRRAEAELVAHRTSGSALAAQEAALQDRARNFLAEAPASAAPARDEVDNDGIQQLRACLPRARAVLQTLEARVHEQAAQRKLWAPMLRAWVQDLQAADSVDNDWLRLGKQWPSWCNVVAVTCNERDNTLDDAGHAGFDVAIIDEVSKATPLELLLPMMRARKTILVGDHRQLPPLFREGQEAISYADAAEDAPDADADASALTPENLQRFERMVTASLFKEHFEAAEEGIRERLTEQFRMHPHIMDLVNHFYDGSLTCGLPEPDLRRAHAFTLVGAGGQPLLSPKDHVLWIDTSRDLAGEVHREDRDRSGGYPRSNALEADLIAHVLKQLDVQAVSQGHSRRNPVTVGVVSFYAAQLRVIREALRVAAPSGWQALEVDVNTVIRYQGKEKDVVLVSLVRNDGRDGKGPARRSDRSNVARYEFINVALSRAKSLLIALGARSMFASYEVQLPNMDRPGCTRKPVYDDMFQRLERDHRMCEARGVMSAVPARNPPRRAPSRAGEQRR